MTLKLNSEFLKAAFQKAAASPLAQKAHHDKSIVILGIADRAEDGERAADLLKHAADCDFQLLIFPEDHLVKKEIGGFVGGLTTTAHEKFLIITKAPEILADAFAENCYLVGEDPEEGFGARAILGGTFGSRERLEAIFEGGSESLSYTFLEKARTADWSKDPKGLKQLIDSIGSSFHRAELRAQLKELEPKMADPSKARDAAEPTLI